tara:strand:+ start:310 stop:522 length:213 start_codon:yes stop_codon:yes gene_type:complete
MQSSTLVLLCSLTKRDGWDKEVNGVLRFSYDWESWEVNPKVLTDRARLRLNVIHFLGSTKRIKINLAIAL